MLHYAEGLDKTGFVTPIRSLQRARLPSVVVSVRFCHVVLTLASHVILLCPQKGASLEIKDNDDNTPLSLALREGHDG